MCFSEQLRGFVLIRSKVFCVVLMKGLIFCHRNQRQLGPKRLQRVSPDCGSGKRAEPEVQAPGSYREIKLVGKLPHLVMLDNGGF